uniref:MULE transposase domain-containing protein n=1 Tax=Nicotiana tabacum TaxID=4097 RepID=A0A1S4CVC6_TOBAC|nr:PREDICTED: uncharacterized protein LOC107822885 [Nicotiana tabacum]
MTFKDIAEARKIINMYTLANGYGLEQAKSDPTRLRYICEAGFPFVCHISRNTSGGAAEFRTLYDEHTCEPAFENHRVNSKTIVEYFNRRLENLEGSFTDECNKLVAYVNELKFSNPGSDVVVNLSKDALAESKRRFLRMYICFHVMKMGFKSGLRPFIWLDGTFLKGKVKGQLLVAVGQDSANHFYPLSWAIVDKEIKFTWKSFLSHLQMSLDLKMGEGITFISDMQKGLIDSISTILPEAHHGFCVRHIKANWYKRCGSGEYKKYLWWVAWSIYEEDFQDQLKSMSQVDDDGKVVVKDLLNTTAKSKHSVQQLCVYATPTVQRQLPTSNDPDFEILNFEPKPEKAIRPKSISEARTRLQLRQQSVPIATRQIGFFGDSNGASQPSKITFSAKGLTW